MSLEQTSPEVNPNAVDLARLVDTALERHASTETIPGADLNNPRGSQYYGAWMAAEEVLTEAIERDNLDVTQLAVTFTQITSAPEVALELFSEISHVSFDDFFKDLAMYIIYAEMRLKNPAIVDIDIERDEQETERYRESKSLHESQ